MLRICVFAEAMAIAPTGAMADGQNDRSAKVDFERFEATLGTTPGKRRNHTEGSSFAGEFSPVDPAILSDGVTVPDDPIVAARSAIYAHGVGARSGET